MQVEPRTGRSCQVYFANKNRRNNCCSGIFLGKDVKNGGRKSTETVKWSDPLEYSYPGDLVYLLYVEAKNGGSMVSAKANAWLKGGKKRRYLMAPKTDPHISSRYN